MSLLPLLPDLPADAVLAYRDRRPVSWGAFLGEVRALAECLPGGGQVLNLCADRYRFAVSLFAAIARGCVSLLPNSTAPENLAALCADIVNLTYLGDQAPLPQLQHLPYIPVGECAIATSGAIADMPLIPDQQPIACVFTSGTTGRPEPHRKTFGRLRQCIAAGMERIWAVTGGPCAVLGTVPFRHMYGLESTVLLPILGGGQLCARTPFFPADVASALAELPMPRLLVTTPFHLRTLLDANIEIPAVAAILSATAPLAQELANRAEAKLGAPVMEIYGSTETGQLATRQPTLQSEWETFPGITLHQEHGVTHAAGGHLESTQTLNDAIDLISPTRFRLIDRSANLINIVGKRSSLAFLNHVITNLPGVRDACFCLPDRARGKEVARLAAFVVAPGLSPADILAALRSYLDPVFLPRPIVMLEALPRDGTGKIPAAAMDALIAAHL